MTEVKLTLMLVIIHVMFSFQLFESNAFFSILTICLLPSVIPNLHLKKLPKLKSSVTWIIHQSHMFITKSLFAPETDR